MNNDRMKNILHEMDLNAKHLATLVSGLETYNFPDPEPSLEVLEFKIRAMNVALDTALTRITSLEVMMPKPCTITEAEVKEAIAVHEAWTNPAPRLFKEVSGNSANIEVGLVCTVVVLAVAFIVWSAIKIFVI